MYIQSQGSRVKDMPAEHFPLRCIKEVDLPDDGFDVKEALIEYFKGLNDKEWTRKVGVHHPSALGGCTRARYYDRLGIAPKPRKPVEQLVMFEVGHAIHDRWQKILQKMFPGFEAELLAVDEELFMAGHCDGVFRIKDWILEIKTVGDSSFRRLRSPKKDHVEQAHCYMWAFDVPRSQILYICRNTGLMKNYKRKFSMETWRTIVGKFEEIEDGIVAEQPPPKEPNTWVCPGCKFFHVCEPELNG